ncbi:MAG TPA: hypothetical protein VK509_24930 [Polyangiales bacterium]|nr:hypothetical protein [Polyangiales bacterium]
MTDAKLTPQELGSLLHSAQKEPHLSPDDRETIRRLIREHASLCKETETLRAAQADAAAKQRSHEEVTVKLKRELSSAQNMLDWAREQAEQFAQELGRKA